MTTRLEAFADEHGIMRFGGRGMSHSSPRLSVLRHHFARPLTCSVAVNPKTRLSSLRMDARTRNWLGEICRRRTILCALERTN
jgi:hypothetical protein